jgi:uncharacterized protein (TIGR00725 family)
MLQIGVIGAGQVNAKEQQIAEQIGAEIARRGHILVCGGLGGVMEAAAKGTKNHGGLTVGILPGESKKDANQYIDVKIVSAMSHARNAIIARSADALIAVGGGAGTLSEIALGLKMGRPVVLVEGALPEYYPPSQSIMIAKNPGEALDISEHRISSLKEAKS